MPSEEMRAFNEEARTTRKQILNSDYDPVVMRSLLAAADAIGPGPDIQHIGDASLELRGAVGDALLVYVPGGGFCFPGGDSHRSLLDQLCSKLSARGALVQYRLAPEHPFPAAHDDIERVLRVLLAEQTGPLYVMCDSAAGVLVLSACLKLAAKGHRLPDRIVGLSVLTDMAMTGRSNVSNADADPLFGPQAVIHKVHHYLQGANPTAEGVSPYWSANAKLPPCLFLVGSTETMRDDTLRFAERARQAGTDVTVSVYGEAPHVFPLLAMLPEAGNAINEIAAFLQTG